MPFVKGKSGNPKGAPKKPVTVMLWDELGKAEKKHKKHLIAHAVEQAYTDNGVLAIVLKKILPDLNKNENTDTVRVVSMMTIKKDGKPLEYNVGTRATGNIGLAGQAPSDN